jgi:hypothetical protein
MKKCTKCGIEKEFTEFYKQARTRTDYQAACKKCNADLKTERRLAFYNSEEQVALRELAEQELLRRLAATHKKCTKCGIDKESCEFSAQKSHKDGLRSHCKTCTGESSKIYRFANKATINRRTRKWAIDNSERSAKNQQRWISENPERVKSGSRIRYLRRAKLTPAQAKQKRDSNPGRYCGYTAKRRALKLKATPSWNDEEKIHEIYLQCKFMNLTSDVRYEVDHIVPLQSKIVSGLHCIANLQILPMLENRRKSNSYWPDMP